MFNPDAIIENPVALLSESTADDNININNLSFTEAEAVSTPESGV